MVYLWAAVYGLGTAGAVCFARKLFLNLAPGGARFWLETAAAAAAGAVLGALVWQRVQGNWVSGGRLLIAAVALAGAARCDLRARRIPNLFAALLLAGFVLCTALDALASPQTALAGFVGGALGGAVVYLFLRLCQRLSHGGIGGGDIKLAGGLVCLVGLYGGFSVLLFAQLSALAAAGVLLLARRITVKDNIPFAPFFFLGLMITVWMGTF